MKLHFSLKFGLLFLFFPLLLIGCSGAGNPDAELKTAFQQATDLFYYEAEESERRAALEQVRQAVANGADPNIVYDEVTPLYLAIWEDDVQLANLLIERGADLGSKDLDQDGEDDSYPPLLIAIMDPGEHEINQQMIKLLIAAGADINGNDEVMPPLGVAAEVDSLDTVRTLLAAGADPNGHKNWEDDYRPLLMAAMNGNVEMFDLLQASGAEVKDMGELLRSAASSTNPEMVKRVLSLYSGPKKVSEVFQYAAWGLLADDDETRHARTKTILEQLRTAGFEPGPDEFDEIMVLAAKTMDKPALEIMLSYGASAKAANDSGETCLMLVVRSASVGNMMESEIGPKGMFDYQDAYVKELVQLLLDHGAEVNVHDKKGRTALMHAATTLNVTAVRQLLERGANRNLTDQEGNSAEQLMLAMGLLKENKKDTAGNMMGAIFGLTPEFKAQARARAKLILVELGSDPSVITSQSPKPPPSAPQSDAKPISKPG
jgi:ankyrin repeat protein